jgi:hypothetical protein
MTSQLKQDLFFDIWSQILVDCRSISYKDHFEHHKKFQYKLEKCFEKIDLLINEGVDINLPYNNSTYNPLSKTIYLSHYYLSCEYINQLIYFLIERCHPNEKDIENIIFGDYKGNGEEYKILEELLKRFEGKLTISDYNNYITVDTIYLEILVGFSCIEVDKKISYSYKKYQVFPIESLLIQYIISKIGITESSDDEKLDKRQIKIRDNIFVLKKYSPDPSYEDVVRIVNSLVNCLRLNKEYIIKQITKAFEHFDFKF